MNLIQKIRSWFFGKDEIVEIPVVEKTTKEEVKQMIKNQESKPKRKYYKKKKNTSETK